MAASRLSVLQACQLINRCGYPDARVNDFAVQNIASAYRFRLDDLDLEKLFDAKPAQTSYEPEVSRFTLPHPARRPDTGAAQRAQLFPALIYRPAPTGTVFLVFESGRVVITGSRSVAGAAAAQRTIDDVLVACYCKRGPAYNNRAAITT